MEAPSRAVSINGDEERALRALVDAFGSNLSAEQILSAFCEAGKRAEVAGQILCDMLGTSSNANGMQNSNNGVSKVSSLRNGNPRFSKMKCPPASVGGVSSFLGKDYVRSKPLASGFRKVEKPMKLNADLLPNATTKDDFMHKEMEDFLYQILGEGFKLDRNTIADTLGKCGYDMQKSLDKLFDHSASVMDRRINQVEDYGQKGYSQTFSLPKKMQQQESSSKGESRWIAKNHLQKEVLNSLFSAPERDEELPVPVLMKCTKRSNIATPIVDEPPCNTRENRIPEANTEESIEDATYKFLRKAVMEHRDTMKEYYKAAIDAFKRGDHDQANKLKETGQFFKTKAAEADEESSRMTFGNKNEEETDTFITLDLHEFTPKEALRSLKLHILNLAGTQSYKYLKVLIECNNEDTSKGARRRLIFNEAKDIDSREKSLMATETQCIRQELKLAQSKIESVVTEFENQLRVVRPDQFNALIRKSESTLASIVEAYQPDEPFDGSKLDGDSEPSYTPEYGDQVYVKGLGNKLATVVADDGDSAVLVQFGKVRVRVNKTDIRAVAKNARKDATARTLPQLKRQGRRSREYEETNKNVEISYGPVVQTSKNSVDLRGMRVEEAAFELDIAISSRPANSVLFIVHGMGTGAVKERAIEILKSHPRVAKFEQESPGNYGCTVAYIR